MAVMNWFAIHATSSASNGRFIYSVERSYKLMDREHSPVKRKPASMTRLKNSIPFRMDPEASALL